MPRRPRSYKGSTFAYDILTWLWHDLTSHSQGRPYSEFKSKHKVHYKKYSDTIYRLKRQGWVREKWVGGVKFLELTGEGELEFLVSQAYMPRPDTWDGKWRMVMFDIPEDVRGQRNKLRQLLRRYGYKALQGSVFVYPYPLSRAAIEFLEKSKLMDYIRIMRIDEMDNDKDLRKAFHLPAH